MFRKYIIYKGACSYIKPNLDMTEINAIVNWAEAALRDLHLKKREDCREDGS